MVKNANQEGHSTTKANDNQQQLLIRESIKKKTTLDNSNHSGINHLYETIKDTTLNGDQVGNEESQAMLPKADTTNCSPIKEIEAKDSDEWPTDYRRRLNIKCLQQQQQHQEGNKTNNDIITTTTNVEHLEKDIRECEERKKIMEALLQMKQAPKASVELDPSLSESRSIVSDYENLNTLNDAEEFNENDVDSTKDEATKEFNAFKLNEKQQQQEQVDYNRLMASPSSLNTMSLATVTLNDDEDNSIVQQMSRG